MKQINEALTSTVEALTAPGKLHANLLRRHDERIALPSAVAVDEIIELSRGLVFPGFFSENEQDDMSFSFGTGLLVAKLHKLLLEQIRACNNIVGVSAAGNDRVDAKTVATEFVTSLPALRDELHNDLSAIFHGDPAALSVAEIIYSYPAIRAIINHRVAHRLYVAGVKILPRMISEHAHRETGIDIHPGATIGHSFMIDHGTGVVIGETAIIGDRCRIYQGVTLGARSFPTDESGSMVKQLPRHPIIGNDVVIYANSTILGRVTIGDRCIVGGNIWITESVPADTTVLQAHAENRLTCHRNKQ